MRRIEDREPRGRSDLLGQSGCLKQTVVVRGNAPNPDEDSFDDRKRRGCEIFQHHRRGCDLSPATEKVIHTGSSRLLIYGLDPITTSQSTQHAFHADWSRARPIPPSSRERWVRSFPWPDPDMAFSHPPITRFDVDVERLIVHKEAKNHAVPQRLHRIDEVDGCVANSGSSPDYAKCQAKESREALGSCGEFLSTLVE